MERNNSVKLFGDAVQVVQDVYHPGGLKLAVRGGTKGKVTGRTDTGQVIVTTSDGSTITTRSKNLIRLGRLR